MTEEEKQAVAYILAVAESCEYSREAVHFYSDAKDNLARNLRIVANALTPKPTVRIPGVKTPRPRNVLLDTLATLAGGKVEEVPPPMWSRCAKALANIRAVCPNVTVEEIHRRAAVYRKKWPDRDLTATALATWWAQCVPNATPPTFRLGDNLK